MALICEDLASYGVVLIPPSSQTYFDLLAELERRMQNQPQGAPPFGNNTLSRISEHDTSGSAILLNRAKLAIASLAYVWTFLEQNGQTTTSGVSPGTNPSVLLPFTQLDRVKKFEAYWNTIFPDSKRLLTADGGKYGDNSDVRPPVGEELSRGGGFGIGSGGRNRPREPLKLTLDGVFFIDGGFAGRNQLGSWDHVVFAREAFLACAALARAIRPTTAAQSDFFAQMQKLSGLTGTERVFGSPQAPPRPPPPFGGPNRAPIREYHQQRIARIALGMRERLGDAGAIAAVAAWEDNPAPQPHKL